MIPAGIELAGDAVFDELAVVLAAGVAPAGAGTFGSGGRGGFGAGAGPGIGTRVPVSDFGRGVFAGTGTTGFARAPGSVGDGRSVCVPRGPGVGGGGGAGFGCPGSVGFGCGGSVGFACVGSAAFGGAAFARSGAVVAAPGSEPGVIKRSSARSRSSSDDDGPSPPEDFGSPTRDHHCRSSVARDAM